MEKRNFFTSGWLFLIIAIVNIATASIFCPLIIASPRGLDEWFAPLCLLIPMSIALAILGIFLPRPKIGVKRVLVIAFNGVSMFLYILALVAIMCAWSSSSYYYY